MEIRIEINQTQTYVNNPNFGVISGKFTGSWVWYI